MNKRAANIAKEMIDKKDELKIEVHKIGGATVIDCGLNVKGSIQAGVYVSKICLGGLAEVKLTSKIVQETTIPIVEVYTDYPVEACFASQLAGWRISVGDFFANGSGPARALARKPKKLYEKIGYQEVSDEAVLVLETTKMPNEEVVKTISKECNVNPENLYLLVVPTNSLAGIVQVAARVVEVGLFRLDYIGFNIKYVLYGHGSCPVSTLSKEPLVTTGKTNDLLFYGAHAYYVVDCDDSEIEKIANKISSQSSKYYGTLLTEELKKYGEEFLYKIDPDAFAIASITIHNIRTGLTVSQGKIDIDKVLKILSFR